MSSLKTFEKLEEAFAILNKIPAFKKIKAEKENKLEQEKKLNQINNNADVTEFMTEDQVAILLNLKEKLKTQKRNISKDETGNEEKKPKTTVKK